MEKMELMGIQKVEPAFWQGKRVLVTGHTGFKGSWLSLWLQMMQSKVFGLALSPNTKPALFNEAFVESGMNSYITDIRDYDNLLKILQDIKPEIIIHMAAQPLVRYSYYNPIETYSVNVMGTVNILEAAKKVDGVKVLINVTTDKCYENKEWEWGYRENEPMGGYDPYSSSKACSELVTSAYRNSFYNSLNIGLATARAGNVIGGGDWSLDRLIPDILKSFEEGEPVLIRNPNSIRPWQHVLEPLYGYLLLAQNLYKDYNKFTGGWNFGPNDTDARPVKWIVDNMVNQWGTEYFWSLDSKSHPHEANYLKLDISKAKAKLGWQPLWDIKIALEKVVDWHKCWLSKKENARALCERQIIEYLDTMNKCL